MAAARRRRLRRTGLATLVVAMLVLLPVAAVTAAPTTPAGTATSSAPGTTEESTSRVTITSITPMVGRGDQAVVRGRVTNTGDGTLTAPKVSVIPQEASTEGSAVRDWARGEDPIRGALLAQTTLGDIPAGDQGTFALTVQANDLVPEVSAGAAWISVQTSDAAVHTFIGVHRTKEYVPMQIVWGIPLLLPPERQLFGDAGADRTDAWREAVGEDSRLAELTGQSPEQDEAWLLDPTLLQPPSDPPDSLPDDRVDDAAAEQELRRERAAAIRETMVSDRTLVLAGADADVAAGAESSEAAAVVQPRVEEGHDLARELGAHGSVVWPADGLATLERSRDYNRLHPDIGRPTVLAPDTSFVPSGFTPTGNARTTDETPLLIRDSDLSQLVSGLQTTSNTSLARQRLIAETAALLRERPGTPRSVLVVPERGSTPAPGTYELLRRQADDIPWLRSGNLHDMLATADEADPVQVPRTPKQLADAGEDTDQALLSPARSREISGNEHSMGIFASVRSDGRTWRRFVEPGLDQLTSTRWRSEQHQFILLHQNLAREVTLSEDELVVSSGDVNFFADTGRLQITVINKTDAELTDLRVRLDPGGPSLRIDEPPEPLTIGPNGRQTVTVSASALAAGQLPVDVNVLSPGGTDLTAPATLHVTVRPTGDAVYWVIGGAAVLLLGVGTWRTVRGGRRDKQADAPETNPTETNPTEEKR